MQILKAKTKSQIRFLELTKNPDVKDAIKILKDSLADLNGKPLATEANLGRIYFEEYVKLIPKRFGFTSRNRNSILISKNKATDVINALLNYGYCVLAGEISKYISSIGLDAYYGFYHKKATGFQLLVYDLLEPFRWLVDYSVYKLANSISTKQRIKQREYSHTKEGLVVMEYDLIRRFLELLERTFQMKRRYAFKHGAKTRDGLKSCQEITIARITVQNLADFCIGKQTIFQI